MSDTQVEKLLKLVKDLRNQIDGQQALFLVLFAVFRSGTSSPNKRFKGDSFVNKAQALTELQHKLGYKFKDEGLLKRALDLFSEGWDNDHCIFKILGKSVMQTCVYYHLVKENSRISKGNLQTSLSEFFGGREYGKEARGLGLEAFVRGPSSNCRCNRGSGRKTINEIDCLYAAVVGAVAIDSSIEQATSIFLNLRKWNSSG